MAEQTARYALPLLQSGQAQKEVTHNTAVATIDALLHLAVESRTLTAPPVAPLDPGNWIVSAGATGAWSGRTGHVAVLDAGAWSFVSPRDGCLAYVRDEGVFAVRIDGAWHGEAWPVRALTVGGRTMLAATPVALSMPTGGAVIDAEARAAIGILTAALRAMGLVAA